MKLKENKESFLFVEKIQFFFSFTVKRGNFAQFYTFDFILYSKFIPNLGRMLVLRSMSP
jgi:hypothetical protein